MERLKTRTIGEYIAVWIEEEISIYDKVKIREMMSYTCSKDNFELLTEDRIEKLLLLK